jgi:hypothetical protein
VFFLLNTCLEKTIIHRFTQEQFAESLPETPAPHRNAVRRLTEKFREIGLVLDAEQSGRPSKRNDKKLMDIYKSMLIVEIASSAFCKCTATFRTTC